MKPEYRLPARLNRKIGRAMHDYAMLAEGDRVLVAVSGGIDSLVLGWVLKMWQQKAPIDFSLTYLHVDHGFWQDVPGAGNPGEYISGQLGRYGIALELAPEWHITDQPRTCFLCARNRRSQLFAIARDRGINKIALGHHKDDLIETFMLNVLYSGNISTMMPRQDLFAGTLSILRPMAYLEKQDILTIASGLGLSAVKNFCNLSDDTRREKVRSFLNRLYSEEPGARASLFAALSNVRKDYLL